MTPYQNRVSQLQKRILPHQVILLSKPTDIQYYCGFSTLVPEEREGFLLIGQKLVLLFHSSFSPLPKNFEFKKINSSKIEKVGNEISNINFTKNNNLISEILIDESSLVMSEYHQLQSFSKLENMSLNSDWIWQQRIIKDTQEISNIKKGGQIAKKTLIKAKTLATTGITEKELACLLDNEMRLAGSERVAFPTIVAFGKNTALPHHQPSNKKLTINSPVLIDLGATFNGYRSDSTRSFWFGSSPSEEYKKVEKNVENAYKKVVKRINTAPTISAKEVDEAARSFIDASDYKGKFTHTTGHGLGLDIHEPPSLNWANSQPILPGIVFTIEPGIYLEGKFGIRYENTVVVRNKKVQRLT